jgi:DNA-directed RNA polymerase
MEAAVKADLANWSSSKKEFIVMWDISKDVQEDLDRYQYPLPMVVEPRVLRTNKDTGYYTSHNSVILKHNHHEEDVCLDHLNNLNRTKFRINQDVATTIKNRWRHLDKPKQDEEPHEFQKRVKAFEKYDRTAADVLNHLGLSNEGEFWLTHKYDKRGRTYCQGYHVNYQAACWNKAVVEFAGQEITE